MSNEPAVKRAFAFFDGQNLFYAVKAAFGYTWPNYDPMKLAKTVCALHGWQLERVCFYTGLPKPQDDPFWSQFWTAKLSMMGRQGIRTFSRPLKYRNQIVTLPDGQTVPVLVGSEKGIDVRLALDVVGCCREDQCDVALIFSQDQDLSEVADEVRALSIQQSRWIKLASAFPISPTSSNRRGINRTEWIQIDRALYDRCTDSHDYRPRGLSR